VNLTIQLHLVPRLRISGAIFLLHGVDSDNFKFDLYASSQHPPNLTSHTRLNKSSIHELYRLPGPKPCQLSLLLTGNHARHWCTIGQASRLFRTTLLLRVITESYRPNHHSSKLRHAQERDLSENTNGEVGSASRWNMNSLKKKISCNNYCKTEFITTSSKYLVLCESHSGVKPTRCAPRIFPWGAGEADPDVI
jgi:hypothetical protein